jgi:4-amino-4-deoxy-L-arabinose transferase-like glycosyltransferase
VRLAAAALAALTLIRFVVAADTPLSPDEAYYWTWSKALASGYLDHPPMVGLWIRLGTILAGDTPLGVRLLAPLSALAGSILAAAAARDLLDLDREHRWAAALLLNATLMVGAGSVTMTPDTPLLFFWTAALWCAGRAHTGSDRWLLGAGAAAGLAFDSKYTGFLLVPAIGLWLLTTRGWRRTLVSPLVWAAALLSLLTVSPVIAWNAAHHFASFTKQGGRTADIHLQGRYLLELIGGQLGLATPLIALLACAGTWQVTRQALRGDQGAALISLATLIPTAIFLEHAAGDRVQANWPSILYPSAMIAAAAFRSSRLPGWRSASVLGLGLTALVYLQATLHPLVLPGRSDITLTRLAGWHDLANQLDRAGPTPPLPIVADDYALASELAWWGTPVLGLDRRWSFTRFPPIPIAGRTVLLVETARRHTPPDPRLWASVTQVATLIRGRAGRIAERYTLYRAVAADLDMAAQLPTRPRLSPR